MHLHHYVVEKMQLWKQRESTQGSLEGQQRQLPITSEKSLAKGSQAKRSGSRKPDTRTIQATHA